METIKPTTTTTSSSTNVLTTDSSGGVHNNNNNNNHNSNNNTIPTLEQRMKSYLIDEQFFGTFFINLPSDTQRKAAANRTYEIIRTRLLTQHEQGRKEQQQQQLQHDDESNNDSDMDSFDSDGELMTHEQRQHHMNHRQLQIVQEQIDVARTFIDALQCDCPMILGFHAVMTHSTADQCCYCPCSKKLLPWRQYHQLHDTTTTTIPLCTTGTQKFNPNGFMDHLRKLSVYNIQQNNNHGTVLYHLITLTYLEILYSNYWGNDIHHRGLYIVSTNKYKAAQAKEKLQDVAMMHRLQEDLCKAQQQKKEAEERAERWKKIKEINPDLLELKQKYDQKMNLLVQLGLAELNANGDIEIIQRKVQKPLTEKEIQRLEQHQSNFLQLCFTKFENKYITATNMLQPIRILFNNQGERPIADWFDTTATKENAFLFGKSIINTERIMGNFFHPWDLTFISVTNPNKKLKIDTIEIIEVEDERDAIEAVDAGGPTRSFLCQLWSQISTITIPIDGRATKIFEDLGEFVVPTQIILPQKRAVPYYRAIGRIIAYCLVHKQPIANHVMPDMYKNYLLRDVTPVDPEYDLTDLINDFYELMKIKRDSTAGLGERIELVLKSYGRSDQDLSLEDADSISLKEKKFRECIDAEIFKPRRIALDAMKQGIRLEEPQPCSDKTHSPQCDECKTYFLPCEQCFSVIPLESVKILLFDDGKYDLDFVLSRMEALHQFGDEQIDTTPLIDIQKLMFQVSEDSKSREGTLVDVLRKKCDANQDFIIDFVWYVTGSRYIRQSDFKIIVEFNYNEFVDGDVIVDMESLPVVHTCENTLKFHYLCYNNDAETLEKKIDIAMANAKECAFDIK